MVKFILKKQASLAGHEARVWHVCWSPDGNFLASCSEDRTVIIWGKKNKEKENGWSHCHQFLRHTGSVRRIEWSPKGNVLVTASFDQHILIHRVDFADDNLDLSTKVMTKIGGHSAEIKSVAFSSKGDLLASTARDRIVNVWDVSDFEEPTCLANLAGHTQDIKCCVWHPTFRHLLVTGSYDNSIRFWLDPAVDTVGLLKPEVDDDSDGENFWKQVELHENHGSTIWDVAFESEKSLSPSSSPSSSQSVLYGNSTAPRFVSASADSSIIVWVRDPVDHPYHLFQRITAPFVDAVVFSVDWSKLGGNACGGLNSSSSSSSSSGSSSSRSSSSSSGGDITVFASGDGNNNILIFAEDKTTHQFAEVVRVEDAHYADVNCVRFSPVDPYLLASAGDDGMVHLWRVCVEE